MHPISQALAQQLQAEEDEMARREYARWERDRQESRRRQEAAAAGSATASMAAQHPNYRHVQRPNLENGVIEQRPGKKPKSQCIIM